MDQRMHFVTDHQRGLYDMTELCARNHVSRKTGYKWLARYDALGAAGLVDRSHAPHVCPHRIADDLAALLLAARQAHPGWGPAAPAAKRPARTKREGQHGLVNPLHQLNVTQGGRVGDSGEG